MEADGTVDAQNAPTAPWKTLRVFHELPQGLSHRITHAKPRKAPKWRWETRIDPFCQVVPANRAATAAPRITEVVAVEDQEPEALHLLLVHRLDYRPQGASPVGNVAVFSKPTYAVFRTERLQLATPAYYREQKDLRPGIRDVRDGTLTKDSIGGPRRLFRPGW